MGRDMLMYVVNNEASSMFGQIPLKLWTSIYPKLKFWNIFYKYIILNYNKY
jgi:hypothetical protein